MTTAYLIALVIALGLFAFLVVALFYPERFS